jgi:hypothetical protein
VQGHIHRPVVGTDSADAAHDVDDDRPCSRVRAWIAASVFVADCCNDRMQVLTPRLDCHCFVGVGQLRGPAGVCANDDVVVVSKQHTASVCQCSSTATA